ncbi:hypothetical protein [Pseudomonas syringae]|uniref:hypothetical protein n=1 Tax=Pseudomonas syringae TaxID=317 RepID=UPI002364EEFD|nr:hypothetical protein [Pseudomonas syringae]GKQ49137.1 hypothetical protein PSTH2693_28295 [Pseudomonas syringae pv. theae]
MKVQRLKTAKEGWFWIVKIFYMLFAFPFLLLMGVAMLFIVNSEHSRAPGVRIVVASPVFPKKA